MEDTETTLTHRLLFAGIVALFSIGISFLVTNRSILYYGGALADACNLAWGLLNLLPGLAAIFVGVSASQNPHHVDESRTTTLFLVLVFVQWFLIGYFFSKPIIRRFNKRRGQSD